MHLHFSWWLICDKQQKSDELMLTLCVCVHVHAALLRMQLCQCYWMWWCQGGDQETQGIRGTIKFLKGFWEEMSCSLLDTWGAGRTETVWSLIELNLDLVTRDSTVECLAMDVVELCESANTPIKKTLNLFSDLAFRMYQSQTNRPSQQSLLRTEPAHI